MAKLVCFTTADEEKLARGWPNLVAPIDGDKADKSARAALKAFGAIDPVYFTEWPRKTLHRYLRAKAASMDTKAKGWDERHAEMLGLATEAAQRDDAPSASEAVTLVRRHFEASDEIYPFQTDGVVYGAEAIAGTDAVLDAIVGCVGAMKTKSPSTAMTSAVGTIHFLLLRASPAAAKRARTSLEKVFAGAPKKRSSEMDELVTALDLALHGSAAARRSFAGAAGASLDGGRGLIGRPELEYCADDAAFVRDHVARDTSQSMSVRVAWLGGSDTLASLSARKWPARAMPSAVRDFGFFRAPEIIDFMLSLVGKTSVKDAPLRWFREHADYASPILAKAKSPVAKTILRQIG